MADRNRRAFLKAGTLAGVLTVAGCAGSALRQPRGHVVVVGGGYGGATAAKYLRMWSARGVEVTLVERSPHFVSCPMSNLVIGGSRSMADITLGYDRLQSHWGVRIVHDEVLAIDAAARSVRLAGGGDLRYDRLVLSPGIDFMWQEIPGLDNAGAQATILHAWKAGAQTVALRRQLEAMPDGGVFVLSVPRAPYRCPPGPYERASLVADYCKRHKPRSKVIVLDANDEIVSKKGLFAKAWAELYPGIIEYRPQSELRDVDVTTRTAHLDFDKVRADVLNVIPPQRAADIAARSGLQLINQRWVEIDWLSMESSNTPAVHVLGDAIFPAPTMPKSGHVANQQAKLAAAAILRLLAGEQPDPAPVLMNTCYSFVDSRNAIHVASVFQYDRNTGVVQPVAGAGGVSSARSELEGRIAAGWAQNIWADMLF
ncbi:MAG TPA: NAD(P)/FAD-dependent oxidoreductase [Candidatus Accumulibacter phosphatis]|nr:MAG: Sulfide dehydrogenase [flavocytochrome c] flavoprotein chain precursor [Candidatus Accumulibacter sp. SK-11]HAY28112.1 flavocytochrome C [Accumulibacter sp.]HCV14444.1 flavocytochrome C [Accumulibacter sp.]HRL74340.1 NAD(P)/FAD-dependent oxidoreductase [Candidatus Accumulibacter phosphatis]HRQ95262.1 NAD(P)/FAD-dependent oxidoreductase [Candidatus Accumulibacter phosphatis]